MRIKRGVPEGDPAQPFREGQIVSAGNVYGVVVKAWSEHIAADGWSLGVGDETGTIYHAELRPLSPAESEQIKRDELLAAEREEAKQARADAFAERERLAAEIMTQGRAQLYPPRFDPRPPDSNPLYRGFAHQTYSSSAERLLASISLPGTREWFEITDNTIRFVRYLDWDRMNKASQETTVWEIEGRSDLVQRLNDLVDLIGVVA